MAGYCPQRAGDAALASGAPIISTDYLSPPNIYGNSYHLAPFAGGGVAAILCAVARGRNEADDPHSGCEAAIDAVSRSISNPVAAWDEWKANWIYITVGLRWALGVRRRLGDSEAGTPFGRVEGG